MRHGAHTRKVFMFLSLMHALVIINHDFLWISLSPLSPPQPPTLLFGAEMEGVGEAGKQR